MKDADAAATTVAVARAAGNGAPERLWLCHHDWRVVAAWRDEFPDVKLVDSTRLRSMKDGPERRAAALAGAGIDAVNLHHTDWTGGLTTLFHRFGVLTFGWDAQYARILDELFDMGIDAVYSDHTDLMVEALAWRGSSGAAWRRYDGSGDSRTPNRVALRRRRSSWVARRGRRRGRRSSSRVSARTCCWRWSRGDCHPARTPSPGGP